MVGGATPQAAGDAEPLILESFLWGLLSASSLNIGSVIGVTCPPSKKVQAMLMAFGGGALIFALSVELFGHVLHRYEQNHEPVAVIVMEVAAVFGGVLFAALNRVLNHAGADVRKPSTRMGTMARMRGLLMRRLTLRLSKVHLFSKLTYNEVAELIQKAMYTQRFGNGDVILSQSHDSGLYFIISGAVRLQLLDTDKQLSDIESPKDGEPDASPTWLQQHERSEQTVHGNDGQMLTDRPHIVSLNDEYSPAGVFVAVANDADQQSASTPCDDTDQDEDNDEFGQSWELGPNQIFGDMRILTGLAIGAEVQALRQTKVLVLPRHEVSHLLMNNIMVQEFVSSGAVDQLKQVPELKHLPDHSLAMLSARCSRQKYMQGDTVFRGVVDHQTPLIYVLLGSVTCYYTRTGVKDVVNAGSLFCTEHFNGHVMNKPFTAKAGVPTTLLFLQRHVLEEVSKMSIRSLGDRMGWNGAVDTDEGEAPRKRRRWGITTKRNATSASDDVLSFITDDELAESIAGDFDDAPVDPWVEAMKNYMMNVHERGVTNKSHQKRELRVQSEAVVEKRVSALNDRASRAKRANGELQTHGKEAKKGVSSEKGRHHKSKTAQVYKPSATAKCEDHVESKEADRPAHETGEHHKGNDAKHTAIMVWLGILIDAIPESLVIGILCNKSVATGTSSASVALPFVISVFLSNLPEAMSSSGSMKSHGMRVSHIMLMWFMTTFITALGALIGAVVFPPDAIANQETEIIVSAVEGVAAGAMLTMIAQTMMPEAFEQGGDVVGLSCLAGFLCAMSVKLIPV